MRQDLLNYSLFGKNSRLLVFYAIKTKKIYKFQRKRLAVCYIYINIKKGEKMI